MKSTTLVAACLVSFAGCARPAPPAAPFGPMPTPTPVNPTDAAPVPSTTASTPHLLAPAPIAGTSAPRDGVIATVKGTRLEVRQSQLTRVLIDGYGLNVLMNLVQLEMARDTAREQNISLSAETLEQERQWTFRKMFTDAEPSDYPKLYDQYLTQQKITRGEFDMVIETNAYLRKIAEPPLKDAVTEVALKAMFAANYGEKVKVRHIALGNMQEVADAKARLNSGEEFSTLARAISRNPDTQRLGGELPEFTLNAKGLPEAFKQVAFSLKPGEVSEPVQAEGSYHLIKLDRRILPKAVKFEDVRESLKTDLHDRLLEEGVKALRQRLAARALDSLQIEDPVMRQQFDARVKERDKLVSDRDGVKKGIKNAGKTNAARATTTPVTAPASGSK